MEGMSASVITCAWCRSRPGHDDTMPLYLPPNGKTLLVRERSSWRSKIENGERRKERLFAFLEERHDDDNFVKAMPESKRLNQKLGGEASSS